jgi:hypothetical protein
MSDLETVGHLEAAYIDLLQVPHSSAWRLENQSIYCNLRDAIAKITRIEPEKIQSDFEDVAARLQRVQRTRGGFPPHTDS